MDYTPRSDKEIRQARGLPEPGDADFEITAAEETKSSKGNPMIKLTLSIWDSEGNQSTLWDYLLPDLDSMAWKWKHFCESLGLDYNSGTIDIDSLVALTGKLVVSIRKSDEYGEQGQVKDYTPKSVKSKTVETDKKSKNKKDDDLDDIPY